VEILFVYGYERSNRLSPVFSPRDRVEGQRAKMVSSSWHREPKIIRRLVFVSGGKLSRFQAIWILVDTGFTDSQVDAIFSVLDVSRASPNQALEPTSMAVTNPAEPGFAPAILVAHL